MREITLLVDLYTKLCTKLKNAKTFFVFEFSVIIFASLK